jgi:SAM-dependent methyltransferase
LPVAWNPVLTGFEISRDELNYYGPFADTYDAHRPRPAPPFVDLLCFAARLDRPKVVVDLGSGTGLSTEIWASRSEQAIGIEPDERMRALAVMRASLNVRYLDASGEETDLADSCADIVTACSSLHWMNTDLVLTEIGRILKRGGVFGASDVVGRSIHPKVDPVLAEIEERIGSFATIRSAVAARREQLEASGYFRSVCDLTLISEEQGDADRVVGLVRSHGQVTRHLASGEWTETGLGLDRLRRVAGLVLGSRTVPFVFTHRVCLAIR